MNFLILFFFVSVGLRDTPISDRLCWTEGGGRRACVYFGSKSFERNACDAQFRSISLHCNQFESINQCERQLLMSVLAVAFHRSKINQWKWSVGLRQPHKPTRRTRVAKNKLAKMSIPSHIRATRTSWPVHPSPDYLRRDYAAIYKMINGVFFPTPKLLCCAHAPAHTPRPKWRMKTDRKRNETTKWFRRHSYKFINDEQFVHLRPNGLVCVLIMLEWWSVARMQSVARPPNAISIDRRTHRVP